MVVRELAATAEPGEDAVERVGEGPKRTRLGELAHNLLVDAARCLLVHELIERVRARLGRVV